MANGKITQIIGAVVDVEFSRDAVPKIYEALRPGRVLFMPEGRLDYWEDDLLDVVSLA